MFHVHAFNPHPLLRHCVDSYLIVSAEQPDGVILKTRFLPHITQSLVFGLDRGIRSMIVAIRNSVPPILL